MKEEFDIKKFLETKDHSGVDLRGVKLVALDLQDHSFAGCDLSGVNFLMSNLAGADLSNAKLDNANFTGANLYSVIWDGSHRSGKAVVKVATILCGDACFYGFLSRDGKKTYHLINEPNKAEYAFTQSGARTETAILVNLLNS
ncbi:pentapeptide repeat-containing protein [bacterium]|nr:pentapeptide repeat-containing protein [bacterium]